MNELNENTLNPNCFEKTKEAWGIFSFFSSTNVETKNVCPIAYNIDIGAINNTLNSQVAEVDASRMMALASFKRPKQQQCEGSCRYRIRPWFIGIISVG
jgi:hypothetical protein